MLYSDRENKEWWDRMSRQDRSDLLDKIYDRAKNRTYQIKSVQMRRKLSRGEELDAIELEFLRKWE